MFGQLITSMNLSKWQSRATCRNEGTHLRKIAFPAIGHVFLGPSDDLQLKDQFELNLAFGLRKIEESKYRPGTGPMMIFLLKFYAVLFDWLIILSIQLDRLKNWRSTKFKPKILIRSARGPFPEMTFFRFVHYRAEGKVKGLAHNDSTMEDVAEKGNLINLYNRKYAYNGSRVVL